MLEDLFFVDSMSHLNSSSSDEQRSLPTGYVSLLETNLSPGFSLFFFSLHENNGISSKDLSNLTINEEKSLTWLDTVRN